MTVRPRRFGHCQISSDATLFELPLIFGQLFIVSDTSDCMYKNGYKSLEFWIKCLNLWMPVAADNASPSIGE